MTFNEFKSEIDAILANNLLGLTSDDLPDRDYRGLFEHGYSPARVANYLLDEIQEAI